MNKLRYNNFVKEFSLNKLNKFFKPSSVVEVVDNVEGKSFILTLMKNDEKTDFIYAYPEDTEISNQNLEINDEVFKWVEDNINKENMVKGIVYYCKYYNGELVFYDTYDTYISQMLDYKAFEKCCNILGVRRVGLLYDGILESKDNVLKSIEGKYDNEKGFVIKNSDYTDGSGKYLVFKSE
jgi:hypothetical protein